MNVGDVGCGDVKWIELAQDYILLRTLVLEVLKFCVLLPEC